MGNTEDAAICMKFHNEREKNPENFNSRIRNKFWYFEFAAAETFSASCRNLHQDVELMCDGQLLDLASDTPLQGIAILNISSTHGGTNLWGDSSGIRGLYAEYKKRVLRFFGRPESGDFLNRFDSEGPKQNFGDEVFEVVGLESCLHIGQVRTGLRASARRLSQCGILIMKTKKQLPMQIDGEPWMQDPCTIKIFHRSKVPVLRAP